MAERKRDTKRSSKTTSTASRTSARPSRAPERSSTRSAARPAAKAPAKSAAKPAAKSAAKQAAKAPARPAAKTAAPAKAAKKESAREVFAPPLTPSPVEELSIPALSPGEWYQQEKRRREAEGPTGTDPLAEAKREYLAMLAAEAEKGKGGRPRGSGANKGKPPVRPTVDDE